MFTLWFRIPISIPWEDQVQDQRPEPVVEDQESGYEEVPDLEAMDEDPSGSEEEETVDDEGEGDHELLDYLPSYVKVQ